MKNLILSGLLSTTFLAIAQNQGTVVYQMSIEGLPPEQAAMMGDMEMKVMWKDNKSYFEQISMMYNIKGVSDGNTSLTLMDMMGNKYYIKQDLNDPKLQEKGNKEKPEYKVEYTNDTKKILNYDCKKAIVTIKSKDGKDIITDVWYTDKIPNYYQRQKTMSKRNRENDFLKGINGMPLEYSIPQGPYIVKVTAKELNFDTVPDSVFNLSTDGYQERKPEDFEKMNGK